MDLKNTINNTNMQKENLKVIRDSINKKLNDIGLSLSASYSEIPNILNKLNECSKYASGTTNILTKQFEEKLTVNTNLSFVPTRIIAYVTCFYNGNYQFKEHFDSARIVKIHDGSRYGELRIINIKKNSFVLYNTCSRHYFDRDKNYKIEWLALS